MKASLAIELIFFGIVLTFLGAFAHNIAPEISPDFRFIGITGGALIFMWGIAGFTGLARHLWPALTLLVTTFFVVREIILVWRQSHDTQRIGVLLLGLVCVFSVGLVVMLIAGARRAHRGCSDVEHGPVTLPVLMMLADRRAENPEQRRTTFGPRPLLRRGAQGLISVCSLALLSKSRPAALNHLWISPMVPP